MARNDEFTLPKLAETQTPQFRDVLSTLQMPTATESQFLPQLQEILGESSPFLEKQITQAKTNVISDLTRRGILGGSIEGHELAGAEFGARADFARGQSQIFAQLVSRARAGDVAAMRELRDMLAQAMGEETTAQRDVSLRKQFFEQQLDFAGGQAAKQRQAAIFGSLIGAGGEIGGGLIGGLL